MLDLLCLRAAMALEVFVSSAEHAGWGDRALQWPQAVVIAKHSRSKQKGLCVGLCVLEMVLKDGSP